MVLNFLPRISAVGDYLFEQNKFADVKNVEYWRPVEISITDASVNPFACGRHDEKVFKPIEPSDPEKSLNFESPDVQFLFAYRCVLYALAEVYNLRNFHSDGHWPSIDPRIDTRNSQEVKWRNNHKTQIEDFRKETTMFSDHIPNLESLKKRLDRMLIEKNYSGLTHEVIDFHTPITLASAAYNSETTAECMINVYPVNKSGDHKVLVSWPADESGLTDGNLQHIREIIENAKVGVSSTSSESPFLEEILGGSYNVYTSTDYYSRISDELQGRICDARNRIYAPIRDYLVAIEHLAKIREQTVASSG